MDLYDDAALARTPSFALNLRRLPTELVHKVIDDLPFIQVLQIISHNHDHLLKCVLTHRKCQAVLETPEALAETVKVFSQYREICRFTRSALVPRASILGHGLPYLKLVIASRMLYVPTYLSQASDELLPQPGTLDMALLENHATTAYPGAHADITTRWQWVKDAKRKLNQRKSQQLNAMADLIAQYPGNVMVKKPLDRSQDGPRTNMTHIENRLRRDASKALINGKLLHRYRGECHDAPEHIEFIPYDRYLWHFLESIERHPPLEISINIQEKLEGSMMLWQSPKTNEDDIFQYPPDILKEINTVLEGLMYIYTETPSFVIPRVNRCYMLYNVRAIKKRITDQEIFSWEGTCEAGSEKKRPTFNVDRRNHRRNLPQSMHRCAAFKIMPYDDREYEWLRAFLKVVSWMENEFKGEGIPKLV